MPYLDFDEIINSLTEEDVIKILTDLGADTYRRGSDGEIIVRTICHCGDSHKLYFYPDNKKLYCYTNCGSMSLPELVQKVKGYTVYEAYSYIGSITNHTYFKSEEQPEGFELSDFSFAKKFRRKQRELPKLPSINENILKMFAPLPYEGWMEEGITVEAMRTFEIGFFGRDNSISIPHRDIYGTLVGIRERWLEEYDVERIGKYTPVFIQGEFMRHPLGDTLYGIFQNQEAIRKHKRAVVFEAEKSVLLSHSYYGSDDVSVATCGSNLTTVQIRLLLEVLGVEEITLAYDKEYVDTHSFKAEAYRNKLYKKIAPIVNKVRCYIIWDDKGLLNEKDSPVDRGKEIYETLMNERKYITEQELEVLKEEGE